MTCRVAWTLRGDLPEPSAFEDQYKKLLVGGAREFVIAYLRLRQNDDESILLQRLDELARTSYWIKETFARGSLAGRTQLRESAPAVAVAFESLALTIAQLKLALAHDDATPTGGTIHSASQESSTASTKRSAAPKEGARLLAASQVFLWTVQGAIDADPDQSLGPPAATSVTAACERVNT